MKDEQEGIWREAVIRNWDTVLNFTCRPKEITKDLLITAVVANKLRKTRLTPQLGCVTNWTNSLYVHCNQTTTLLTEV